MQTQIKTSGSKTWVKVTGDVQQLERIAGATQQPVKPASGWNPQHVDIPVRHAPAFIGLRQVLSSGIAGLINGLFGDK
jgi:hypothetical protein